MPPEVRRRSQHADPVQSRGHRVEAGPLEGFHLIWLTALGKQRQAPLKWAGEETV
jgi:hypothetical protein